MFENACGNLVGILKKRKYFYLIFSLVFHSFLAPFSLHLGSIWTPFWAHFGSILHLWGGPGQKARKDAEMS